jgi:GT2 family glycosyltransferase
MPRSEGTRAGHAAFSDYGCGGDRSDNPFMGFGSEWASGPRVSFVLPTYNRRDVLLHTLERVQQCGLAQGAFEVLVIDNASSDGTARAVRACFPSVVLLPQTTNRGPCAKNAAVTVARGEFVVFLDDDSFPQPGAVSRMIEHFERDPRLGAAVFTITLPDGSRECSAYPDVCIGCGTGFRRAALREVGGLPEDFFMAAEEYDLSLRLLNGGWLVRPFDDLHVTHLKTPGSRYPRRVARLDARNNTLLALRYFPDVWRMRYAMEWLERYRLMAIANNRRRAFWAGAAEGMARGLCGRRRPISTAAFEQFVRLEQTCDRVDESVRRLNLRRILLADLGKNILAYRLAARRCGVEVLAIADPRLGGRGMRFRGIPVVADTEAAGLSFDAVVVSNLSPVHARLAAERWTRTRNRPVLNLFADGPTACIPPRAAA